MLIMFSLPILLILLSIFLSVRLNKLLQRKFIDMRKVYERLNSEHENLLQENYRLKKGNSDLERSVEETTALYDITEDIFKSLDEEKIFALFKERINRYIKVETCEFLKENSDLSLYKNHAVLPLMIKKKTIGYLVAVGVEDKDLDKFQILAQQFLIGIKRAHLYQRVQELTITDSLTQVFNRRYFFERFNEEMARSRKFNLKLSFLMIDIDHFKEYNDQYGHLVGDGILKEITKTIKENMRQIDFIGRYGGEELSIILSETDKEQARYAAERIRQSIESKRISVYDEDLKVTISIGISSFPDDANEDSALIERADEALYQAKQTGRNRTCAYEAP